MPPEPDNALEYIVEYEPLLDPEAIGDDQPALNSRTRWRYMRPSRDW